MLLQLVLRQFVGTITFAVPITVAYYFYPAFSQSILAWILCALAVGIYTFYAHYTSTKTIERTLMYFPSGCYKEYFDRLATICDINPQSIRLRYGYTNSSVATTIFKTICIDPILWQEFCTDPEAIKALEVLDKYIIPGLSAEQKTIMQNTKQILCPAAQSFFFKHELGHVINNASIKILISYGIVGFLATFCGITAAMASITTCGVFSLLIGMVVGGTADSLFTYLVNATVKYREEKMADQFAVRYSSAEEMYAAADFFEKHQEIIEKNQPAQSLRTYIPGIFLDGHQHGNTRARYLRLLAARRSNH